MTERDGFTLSQRLKLIYDAQQDKTLWVRVLSATDALADEGTVVLYAGGAKLVIGLAAWAELVAAVAATQTTVSAEVQAGLLRDVARIVNAAAREVGWLR